MQQFGGERRRQGQRIDRRDHGRDRDRHYELLVEGAGDADQERHGTNTYITLAQRAGFSLEEIADQLAILPNIHPLPPKVWEPLRKKWEQRIDQTIVELKQLKIDLRRCARDASR